MVAGKPLDHAYTDENVDLVKKGCCNLARHVENARQYGVPVVVACNRFAADTDAELAAVKEAALQVAMLDFLSSCVAHAHQLATTCYVCTMCSMLKNVRIVPPRPPIFFVCPVTNPQLVMVAPTMTLQHRPVPLTRWCVSTLERGGRAPSTWDAQWRLHANSPAAFAFCTTQRCPSRCGVLSLCMYKMLCDQHHDRCNHVRELVIYHLDKPPKTCAPTWHPAQEKIEIIAKQVYRASGVEYLPEAEAKVQLYTSMGFDKLPICMAKTQYSFSHDAAAKGAPEGFVLPIR